MCGIAGFCNFGGDRKKNIEKMKERMYHRGPDAGGSFFSRDGQVTLGHRRLSIVDLSENGAQPMTSHSGRYVIAYNGEIYNYRKIAAGLLAEKRVSAFRGSSDTEVLLEAVESYGVEKAISLCKGMFAMALYDQKEQILYLVRDRIGEKPLYYGQVGGSFAFASDIGCLTLLDGFDNPINRDVLDLYFVHGYIPAPYSIYQGIYKLEAGNILTLRLPYRGLESVRCAPYWSVKEAAKRGQENPFSGSPKEAADELERLLTESVREQMVADVPVGAFLSAGIDSSTIVALMQSLHHGKVKSFTIGMEEKGYNEAVYAREIADHLGTEHTELYITEADAKAVIPKLAHMFGEPFADSSQIPTMLVSELARKDVTVALSGDGGDEFFCGYNSYENVRMAQLLDPLGRLTYDVCNLPLIRGAGLEQKLPFRVRVVAQNRDRETKTQLGSHNYLTRAAQMVPGDGLPCRYPIESGYGVKNWQVLRMLVDMDTYLPGDILCKVDRASMKYSLEARCPILDKDVMEYSFRMDHGLKYEKGNKKRILKDIAYDYLPKELLDRPKTGFGVPLDRWLRGPLKQQLTDMCGRDYLKRQGIFDAEFVGGMIGEYLRTGDGGPATGANYSKLSWSFFTFQQWYDTYFCGQ